MSDRWAVPPVDGPLDAACVRQLHTSYPATAAAVMRSLRPSKQLPRASPDQMALRRAPSHTRGSPAPRRRCRTRSSSGAVPLAIGLAPALLPSVSAWPSIYLPYVLRSRGETSLLPKIADSIHTGRACSDRGVETKGTTALRDIGSWPSQLIHSRRDWLPTQQRRRGHGRCGCHDHKTRFYPRSRGDRHRRLHRPLRSLPYEYSWQSGPLDAARNIAEPPQVSFGSCSYIQRLSRPRTRLDGRDA